MDENRTIYITEDDAEHLKTLLEAENTVDNFQTEEMRELEEELEQNKLVVSDELPSDVVSIRSTVRLLDLDTQEEMTWTLVFPEEADIEQDKISVFAPVGNAMLGRSVGDTFEWEVPAGVLKFEVKEIVEQGGRLESSG